MKKPYTSFVTGLLVGVALFSGTTAYAAGIMAERSTHRIYVDGREVQMEAYRIKGNNYVKLRDIGEQVGFNVYWDSVNGCVQVESGKPYTGKAPAKAEPDKPESHPESTAPTNDADVDAMKQDIVDRTNALRKESGIAAQRQAHAGRASASRRNGRQHGLFPHQTGWSELQYGHGLPVHGGKHPSDRHTLPFPT